MLEKISPRVGLEFGTARSAVKFAGLTLSSC